MTQSDDRTTSLSEAATRRLLEERATPPAATPERQAMLARVRDAVLALGRARPTAGR